MFSLVDLLAFGFGCGVVGGLLTWLVAQFLHLRSYGYIEIHDDLEGLGKELIKAKAEGHLSFTIDLVDVNCQVAIVDPRVNYLERMIK